MVVINYNNNNNWTVPSDCKYVDVECWGGGGGGGANNRAGNNAGSGGGGGAYAKTLGIVVTPGQVITMVVGGGGAGGNNNNNGANGVATNFNNNQVKAAGGLFGRSNGGTGGAGGTTANSVGTSKFAGGAGAIKNVSGAGGGGGAAAGNNNTGNSATAATPTAGVGQQGGGSGGNGGSANNNGNNASTPGGGGGGAGNNVATTVKRGGNGGAGSIILTYTPTLITNDVASVTQTNTISGTGKLAALTPGITITNRTNQALTNTADGAIQGDRLERWGQSCGFVDNSPSGSGHAVIAGRTINYLWLSYSTDGASWANVQVAALPSANGQVLACCQSSNSDIHFIITDAGNILYRRYTPTYSAGVMTSFSQDASFQVVNPGGEVRYDMRAVTQGANEYICTCYSYASTGSNVESRASLFSTTETTATFTGINGSGTYTQIVAPGHISGQATSVHDHGTLFIQHPTSGALMFFCGFIEAEFPLSYDTTWHYFAAGNGTNWNTATLTEEAGTGTYCLGSVCAAGSSVYKARVGDSTNQYCRIDKVDSSGTVTQNAFPAFVFSPNGSDYSGWAVIGVTSDEATCFITTYTYWNYMKSGSCTGGTWTLTSEPDVAYALGYGGVGWTGGAFGLTASATNFATSNVGGVYALITTDPNPQAGSVTQSGTLSAVSAGALTDDQTTSAATSGTLSALSVGVLTDDQTTSVAISGTLSAAGSLTDAQTSSVATSGTINGTGSLTNDQTTSVATSGTLSALSVGVLTADQTTSTATSGTLIGFGALTDSQTAAVATSGTLSAVGVLTDSQTTSVTESGTLSALSVGVLNSSQTTSVTESGTLSAVGVLTDSQTTAATASGTLSAVGALADSQTASVTASGILVGFGSLTDAQIISVAESGTLSAVGSLTDGQTSSIATSGTLSATGSVVSSQNLSVSVTGSFDGSAELNSGQITSVAASGTLSAVGLLTDAQTSSVATSGTIQGTGILIDSQTTAVAASGTLSAVGSLADAQTSSVVTAGTVQGTGSLTDAQASSAAASGILSAVGALADAQTTAVAASGALSAVGSLTDAQTSSAVASGILSASGNLTDSQTISVSISGTLTSSETIVSAISSHTTSVVMSGTLSATGAITGYQTSFSNQSGSFPNGFLPPVLRDLYVLPDSPVGKAYMPYLVGINQSLGFQDNSIDGSGEYAIYILSRKLTADYDSNFYLYTSSDLDTFAPVYLAAGSYFWNVLTCIQDHNGKIHTAYQNDSGNVIYVRYALTHSSGLITGATQEASFTLRVPAHTNDNKLVLHEVIANDNTYRIAALFSDASGTDLVPYMATLSLTASSSSDVMDLTGSAGWTALSYRAGVNIHGGSSNFCQVLSTKAMLVSAGDTCAEYPTFGISNWWLTPTGTIGWTVGTREDETDTVPQDLCALVSTATHIYRTTIGDGNLIRFQQYSDTGTRTNTIFPDYNVGDGSGWVSFSIAADEARAWFIAGAFYGAHHIGYLAGGVWDATVETSFTDLYGCFQIPLENGLINIADDLVGGNNIAVVSSIIELPIPSSELIADQTGSVTQTNVISATGNLIDSQSILISNSGTLVATGSIINNQIISTSNFGNLLSVGEITNIDPRILKIKLQNILGSALIGLWVGEDLVSDGADNITSWPGQIGPTLANATVNRFLKTTENGRPAFYSPNSNPKALIATDATDCNSAIIVAKAGTIPAAATTYLYTTIGGLSDAAGISSGTSNWYASGATFRKNGLITNSVDTNQNIYEISSINTMRGINLCGNGISGGYGNPWVGTCNCLIKITSMTDEQRTAVMAVVSDYYSHTNDHSVYTTTSGIISATGNLTNSQTPSIISSGTIIGFGELISSQNQLVSTSGIINGFGNLISSQNPTITNIATLSGLAAMTSTQTISEVNSGALSGLAAITGSHNSLAINSGTLSGVGGLSSFSSLSTSHTGTIISMGSSSLISAQSITTNLSGLLFGNGAVTSSTINVTNQTGTVTGLAAGPLTSSQTVQFQKNIITLSGVGALNLNQSSSIFQSSVIFGVGNVSSLHSESLNQSGLIIGVGDISSTHLESVITSASFSGFGGLTSSNLLTVSAFGTLNGSGSFISSNIVNVNSSGNFSGQGLLSGSHFISNINSGNLTGIGNVQSNIYSNEDFTTTLNGIGVVVSNQNSTSLQTSQLSSIVNVLGDHVLLTNQYGTLNKIASFITSQTISIDQSGEISGFGVLVGNTVVSVSSYLGSLSGFGILESSQTIPTSFIGILAGFVVNVPPERKLVLGSRNNKMILTRAPRR